MASRTSVILCLSIGCATTQSTSGGITEDPPDECLERPSAIRGPKLSADEYQGAIASYDLEAIGGHLATAVLDAPTDASAQLALAHHLAETGDTEGSITQYRCALALDPAQTDARLELAAQLVSTSAWSDAQAELQKVLSQTEPNFRIRSLMASALEGLGQLRAAADELARAAEETKSSAVLYRRAADLYQRAGDDTLAAQLDARADELDPPPEPRKMRPLREARPAQKNRKPPPPD